MKKLNFFLVLPILLSLLVSNTYATPADDLLYVDQKLDNMRVPSAEPKGIYGEILTRVFDTSGKIKSVFYDFVGYAASGYFTYFNGPNLVSGPVYTDGTNVGIGTASPSGKLVVYDAGVVNVKIDSAGNNATSLYLTENNGQHGWRVYSDGGVTGHISTRLNDVETNILSIPYAGSYSNNVGIGTSTPAYKLDVNGSLNATSINENGTTLSSKYLGKTSKASDADLLDGLDSSSFLQSSSITTGVYDDGTSDSPYTRLSLDSFHTNGLGVGQMFIEGRAIDSNSVIEIGKGLAGGQLAQDIHLGDNSEIVVDTSANSVGVGTSTPAYKLDVNGDIRTNGWLRTTGNTGWYNQTHGGGWYMTDSTWIRSYNNKNIYHNSGVLRTDGTFQVGPTGNRLIVNTSGNVGINTTSPSAKLEVNGNAKISGILTTRETLGTDSNTTVATKGYVDQQVLAAGSECEGAGIDDYCAGGFIYSLYRGTNPGEIKATIVRWGYTAYPNDTTYCSNLNFGGYSDWSTMSVSSGSCDKIDRVFGTNFGGTGSSFRTGRSDHSFNKCDDTYTYTYGNPSGTQNYIACARTHIFN